MRRINNKGFTLAEVLVVIFLVSLTLGALALILGSGFGNVFESSHKNKALFKAQDDIEEEIATVTYGNSSGGVDGTVTINIPGSKINFTSNGKVVIGEAEEKGVPAKLVTFVPKEFEEGVENEDAD